MTSWGHGPHCLIVPSNYILKGACALLMSLQIACFMSRVRPLAGNDPRSTANTLPATLAELSKALRDHPAGVTLLSEAYSVGYRQVKSQLTTM